MDGFPNAILVSINMLLLVLVCYRFSMSQLFILEFGLMQMQ